MKKAIVTGGAGFIGHHLVKLLVEKGYEVEVWDDLSTGKRERVPEGVEFRQINLGLDTLPNIKADVVFHLAAPVSVQESLENPYKYEQGCYMNTKRVIDWAIGHGVKDFAFASTAAVYGEPEIVPVSEESPLNPMSPYAEWKLNSEHLMRNWQERFGIRCTALRLFNVFGEGQHDSGSYAPAVALFLKQFEAYKPITVTGDGLQTRDYIYVGDVVKAFLAAVEHPSPEFRVMNVGTGEETTILEIAEAFGGEIKHIDPRIEPRRSCANASLVRKNLNWQPEQSIIGWINQVK